ncbi:hypothetical protein J8F10_27955 [Gemmata sp. G18]|uniref:DUF1795 domain-containing protein n=1 Tax=Gemmata palustris TaxID=2822762 RepID=A0ABS5C0D0_9BACT|nr:hypothetical protein [Gemmata palustris]MBP3959097.1 hypothetical protein [Gemmata palustris]
MFVPVHCTSCDKPFQVPDEALGRPTLCPWCQAVVTALPVTPTVVEPALAPPGPPHTPEPPAPVIPVAKLVEPRPLSLDEDVPPKPRARRAAPHTSAKPRAVLVTIVIVAALAITVVVMGLTVAALGYGSGRVSERGWTEYTPPDGSCSVLLPGRPTEEDTGASTAESITGGKRFTSEGWYTRSTAWLAWGDLDPGFAASIAADKDKVFTASAIRTELDREKARLEGTVTKEAEIRFKNAWGIEVHMDSPRGKVVEWLILVTEGGRPRLYVYGVRAKNIAHDSAVVRRMFTSFKVND